MLSLILKIINDFLFKYCFSAITSFHFSETAIKWIKEASPYSEMLLKNFLSLNPDDFLNHVFLFANPLNSLSNPEFFPSIKLYSYIFISKIAVLASFLSDFGNCLICIALLKYNLHIIKFI